MKTIKILLFIVTTSLIISSCGGDDTSNGDQQQSDQYTVEVNNIELTDNYTWTTSNIGEEGNMILDIKNTSDETIYFKIKFLAKSDNADTQELELCLGNCYNGIIVNNIYPSDTPFQLEQGQTSPHGSCHIKNNDNRNGAVWFKFKLFQTDQNGNELTNKKSITFTYEFQP